MRGKTRNRTVILLAGTAALVALAALAFARRPLLEEWHLWRLDASDRQTRLEAMYALWHMRSPRLVPRFLELVASERDEEITVTAMGLLSWMDPEPTLEHLRTLVSKSTESEAEVVRRHSATYLRQLGGLEWLNPSASWPRDPRSIDDFRLILVVWKSFLDGVK